MFGPQAPTPNPSGSSNNSSGNGGSDSDGGNSSGNGGSDSDSSSAGAQWGNQRHLTPPGINLQVSDDEEGAAMLAEVLRTSVAHLLMSPVTE